MRLAHSHRLLDDLERSFNSFPEFRSILVAYSGGIDSTALLHALSALRSAHGLEVRAMHVNHGLHPAAGDWQAHCARFCAELGFELETHAVAVESAHGRGPEDAARRLRYRALAAEMRESEVVCTAHQRSDQAETVLLKLLRGAGPSGLRGMARVRRFGRGWLGRPLLGTERAVLSDYVTNERLRWIDDTSNRDLRFDRNFLRHEIIARLAARWPGAEALLDRASRHQAEALALIGELGAMDLVRARGTSATRLSCRRLRALSAPRQRNVLRTWIAEQGFPTLSQAQLGDVQKALDARADRMPVVRWSSAEIRRYRDELFLGAPLAKFDPPSAELRWAITEPLSLAHGRLWASATEGNGLVVDARADELRVRFRVGGERCRTGAGVHRQPLKKLFQQHGIPPWLRGRLPLVYVRDELVCVAGGWLCDPYRARPGQPGFIVHWQPADGEAKAVR